MASYGKIDPGKQDIRLLWQSTIIGQVNRVMNAFSEGDPSLRFERIFMAVMGLDSILKWYQDNKFTKQIGLSEDGIKNMMVEMRELKLDITEGDKKNIDFLRSKFRLDRLMELIGRAGFYPERDTGATEEDGVYEKAGDSTEDKTRVANPENAES